MTACDCIIVGAGISGIYAGLTLQKKYPNWKITILEKYKGLGGRTYTYSPPDFLNIHWEMGAGRISSAHTMIKSLIRKYNLTLIPLSSELSYKLNSKSPIEDNKFEKMIVPMFIQPLLSLPDEDKAKYTVYQLIQKIYGPSVAKELSSEFSYWAEMNLLRADIALESFTEGEMSFKNGFFVIKEGFSELISRMVASFKKAGGTILPRHTLEGVENIDGLTVLSVKTDTDHVELKTKCCVLALHCDALRKIQGVRKIPQLRYVKSAPLFRIYAIFSSPVWFQDLPRLVTAERPRYIIPVGKNVIMISYTDGDDTNDYAKVYNSEGDKALQKIVMSDIRKLFPEMNIPDPIFFKGHYWDTGASYWVPGTYIPEEESVKVCNGLLPNVYVCGESFSMKQAWVEGALEHTEMCMKILMDNQDELE
jgi:monoamine oxidase